MVSRTIKEKMKRLNAESIINQYMVPYGANDTSRYKHIDELLLDDGNVIKATLGPIDLSVYAWTQGGEYIVPAYEENRLDIIAYKVYGKASMWWAIAYASYLSDPLDVPAGTVLRIPSLAELKRFPNPLA